MPLPDGLVVVVKKDCETCVMVAPVLVELAADGRIAVVISQDDPTFPDGAPVIDDRDLAISWRLETEVTPTLYRIEGDEATELTVGWRRSEWDRHVGPTTAGADLPDHRPGCGSMTQDPATAERLRQRFDGAGLGSRRIELGSQEDPIEAAYGRGWSDGLPVVPPTVERVQAMLAGTTRPADEVVVVMPPDLVDCTVEKVAVNAVMAGCKPEYLPVVLAGVEAVATDTFNMHGLAATTFFSGPILIVNGPIARKIGMNSGMNALGQGNRANATIGRAVNLVVRNVGGAVPGGIDRATLGSPGKYTFCFAEDEDGSPWESLATERGIPKGISSVTVFAGQGPQAVMDQLSRQPESLARSLAASLSTVGHAKLALAFDAVVVISPEHARVFAEAGWDKDRLRAEILSHLMRPGAEMVRGAGGIAEGVPEAFADAVVPKFRPDGLWFVHAGGTAGLFSAILGGWVNGETGSQMTTKEIGT